MDKTEAQNEQVAPAVAAITEESKVEKPQENSNGVAAAPATTATPETKEEVKQEEKAVDKPTEDAAKTPAEGSSSKPAEKSDDKADAIEEVNKDKTADDKPKEEKEAVKEDTRPEYIKKNKALAQFFEHLPAILEKAGHGEMWGVTLKDFEDIPTVNVLIKFLRANEGDLKDSQEQLKKALKWRKKMEPLEIVENSKFSMKKFGGLGYVTTYDDEKKGKVVFTWNTYGAAKDVNATFGDLDEFIKWRVALMELAVRELKLNEATEVIDYNGEDPYQMIQVHDYQGVSYMRMNSTIRKASKMIQVFSLAYPELLSEKFFVNVPMVMGWVFTAFKVFLSKNTIRKFHPITNGANLAREFSGFGPQLPKSYGGEGKELEGNSTTVALVDDTAETSKEEAAKSEPEAKKDSKKKDKKKDDKEEKKSEKKAEDGADSKAEASKPEEKPTEAASTEKVAEEVAEKAAVVENGVSAPAEVPVEAK